jgi:hypothetical protein
LVPQYSIPHRIVRQTLLLRLKPSHSIPQRIFVVGVYKVCIISHSRVLFL